MIDLVQVSGGAEPRWFSRSVVIHVLRGTGLYLALEAAASHADDDPSPGTWRTISIWNAIRVAHYMPRRSDISN